MGCFIRYTCMQNIKCLSLLDLKLSPMIKSVIWPLTLKGELAPQNVWIQRDTHVYQISSLSYYLFKKYGQCSANKALQGCMQISVGILKLGVFWTQNSNIPHSALDCLIVYLILRTSLYLSVCTVWLNCCFAFDDVADILDGEYLLVPYRLPVWGL